MYFAYLTNRSDKDPSEGWYGGEIWFFDNYVIPLAGKLRECGVFGVSSDEYLNYAQQNRHEWERKGHQVVASMKVKVEKEAQALGLKRMDVVEEDGTESSVSKDEGQVSVATTSSSDSYVRSTGSSDSRQTVQVVAPPGKLGITIDSSSGSPVVDGVDRDSPLKGSLSVGDVIVEVDSVDTRTMAASAIAALLAVREEHGRHFVVQRGGAVREEDA